VSRVHARVWQHADFLIFVQLVVVLPASLVCACRRVQTESPTTEHAKKTHPRPPQGSYCSASVEHTEAQHTALADRYTRIQTHRHTHTVEVWVPPQQILDRNAIPAAYMCKIIVAKIPQCATVAALCRRHLRACIPQSPHARTHARTHASTHVRAHTNTHAHAHAHMQRRSEAFRLSPDAP
jgi:hypothetical protein